MSEVELAVLASEFNQVQLEQRARLIQLFEAVQARKNYRRVEFGRALAWSNCWEQREDVYKKMIEDMAPQVSNILQGDD